MKNIVFFYQIYIFSSPSTLPPSRLQRRKLKSLSRSCLSLLKALTCMVLELLEMIWRKVSLLVYLNPAFSCYIQNNIGIKS